MLAFRPDITIRSTNGYPVALIEVKNQESLSQDMAITYRRNLLAHGMPLSVPYFLLLSQDRGFLWRQGETDKPSDSPAVTFDMRSVVRRYDKSSGDTRLFGITLELLILQWLTNVSVGHERITQEPEKTLATTGFIEAIRDGDIVVEDAV